MVSGTESLNPSVMPKRKFKPLQTEPLLCYRILLCLIGLLCAGACQQYRLPAPEAVSSAIDTITIVAYNVENLFDLRDNGDEYALYKPYTHNWNDDTYQIKVAHIASVIAAIRPTIAILCEVENSAAGKAVQAELKRKKLNLPYLFMAEKQNATATGQLILSAYPFLQHAEITVGNYGSRQFRTIPEVDVSIHGTPLKLFAVHFPAKSHRESDRLLCGRALQQRISQLTKGIEYIIAGDFNSNYNEAETFLTEMLDDTQGETAINHSLRTVASKPGQHLTYVTKTFLRNNPDNHYHYNLWFDLPITCRMSYVYKGANNTLDNMLIPYSLLDSTGISYIDGSFTAFTWFGRLLYDHKPFRWELKGFDDNQYHTGVGYSDHLPIMARFVKKSSPVQMTAKPADTMTTAPGSSLLQKTAPTESCVNDFETGAEGWMPYSSRFSVSLDTMDAFKGTYCLSIRGASPQTSNADVAHCRLRLSSPVVCSQSPSKLALFIKGSGSVVFALRFNQEPWFYYHGTDFQKQSGSPRYQRQRFNNWQSIQLKLPPYENNKAETLEIKIKNGKNADCSFWLDDIALH
ncbi:MAG: hypothetical protein JW795_09335 [Chitinivibrionales bacterium]|nr:hypothetical protein [Chitinivibrionales bacterium]